MAKDKVIGFIIAVTAALMLAACMPLVHTEPANPATVHPTPDPPVPSYNVSH